MIGHPFCPERCCQFSTRQTIKHVLLLNWLNAHEATVLKQHCCANAVAAIEADKFVFTATLSTLAISSQLSESQLADASQHNAQRKQVNHTLKQSDQIMRNLNVSR
jgi:hypothetical protein